jgi:hypothetical protein
VWAAGGGKLRDLTVLAMGFAKKKFYPAAVQLQGGGGAGDAVVGAMP